MKIIIALLLTAFYANAQTNVLTANPVNTSPTKSTCFSYTFRSAAAYVHPGSGTNGWWYPLGTNQVLRAYSTNAGSPLIEVDNLAIGTVICRTNSVVWTNKLAYPLNGYRFVQYFTNNIPTNAVTLFVYPFNP